MNLKKIWSRTPKLMQITSIVFTCVLLVSFVSFVILISRPQLVSNVGLDAKLFELSVEELDYLIEENEQSNSFVGKSSFFGKSILFSKKSFKYRNTNVRKSQLLKRALIVRKSRMILLKNPKCLPIKKFAKDNTIINICTKNLNVVSCRRTLTLTNKDLEDVLFYSRSCNSKDSKCLRSALVKYAQANPDKISCQWT